MNKKLLIAVGAVTAALVAIGAVAGVIMYRKSLDELDFDDFDIEEDTENEEEDIYEDVPKSILTEK